MVTARSVILGVSLLVAGGSFVFAANPPPQAAAVVIEKENLVEAQPHGRAWQSAERGAALALRDRLRTGEYSRAAVQLTDRSVLRVDELTTIEISPALQAEQALEVKKGGIYFLNRDKPQQIEIRTAAANGAIKGTEFALRVATSGRMTLAMFEGEVELSNAHGRVMLRSGEQGEAEIGQAPRKTAMIEAVNIIQWCLYYPAVLDPAELRLGESRALAAYRAGDLPGALAAHSLRAGGSSDERLFRAAVILSVGQVEKARAALAAVPGGDARRQALEEMIAAVQFREWTGHAEPRTASQWLAHSYHRQSRGDLPAALQAARKAAELSPDFGYAWTRVAELEFSFGHTLPAMQVNERSLALAPRNAQALALQGFLLSAENRVGAARRSFDAALALDGALGNAWLGRGLTFIRQGRAEEGRRDLQAAAALEPNRSILRSYLGKAFGETGLDDKANLEFRRAKEIDAADPTPWLYSAIQRKQENRYNEAIADLEQSIELNDNRRVYRSQFLLDQDRAVRAANLAAIYRNDGMTEQSVREAIRAVASDYTSAAAHLFLANSYNELRDPQRIRLRYDPAWFSELLISNMLAPVGGGPLSQLVSEQEYSKLFERDGLGAASLTEYFSNGELRESASQFGTFGNLSYSLDAEYFYSDGIRPNNRLSRLGLYGAFQLQLGPQDTVLFRARMGDLRSGDVFQRYDPREVSVVPVEGKVDGVPNRAALTFHAHEEQDPGMLLLGWHHEWSPGQHTLLLLGRLANEYSVRSEQAGVPLVYRDVTQFFPLDYPNQVGVTIPRDRAYYEGLEPFKGRAPLFHYGGLNLDFDFRADFVTYSAELQHLATLGPMTLVAGARYQSGEYETRARLTNPNNNNSPDDLPRYLSPPADQRFSVEYERLNFYLYDIWRIAPWLSLTAGATYDRLDYPENFLSPPLNDRQQHAEKLLPKVGLILEPWRGATLRAAYTEALGGASFDEGVRLEPAQIAGFLQVHRNLVSESLVGSVTGSEFRLTGISLEQKLPTRTYLGVEAAILEQDVDRTVGVFDALVAVAPVLSFLPSSLPERDRYREESITATVNQLVGDRWAFGARYRFTHSQLEQTLEGFDAAARAAQDSTDAATLARASRTRAEANLHELNLYALYNHPSGFFARGEANWYRQDNDELQTSATLVGPEPGLYKTRFTTRNVGRPGEDFWQFNVFAGYRFHRNQCELSCGVLNLTGADYRLNPVNPYNELVRDRTFMVRCRLNF